MEFARLVTADDLITTGRQFRDQKLHFAATHGFSLHREEESLLIDDPLDRLLSGEARTSQFEIDLLSGCSQMQTPTYSIARDDVQGCLLDRKSTRLNSSHRSLSRMPSSA